MGVAQVVLCTGTLRIVHGIFCCGFVYNISRSRTSHWKMTDRKSDLSGGAISDTMRLNICKRLSGKITSDGSKLEDLLKSMEDQLLEMRTLQEEQEIRAEEASIAFTEGKSRLVSAGEVTVKELDSSLAQAATCLDAAGPFLGDLDDESLTDAEESLKKVRDAEVRIEYLKWLELFQEQSDCIRSSLTVDSTSDAMAFLQTLVDWCGDLRSSSCTRLINYFYDLTVHWTRIAADRVARPLPEILNHIGFPRPPSVQKSQILSVDERSRADIFDLVILFLRLRLPDFIKPSVPTPDSSFLHELLPLKYFVAPLEKRFRFHFFVSEKTNRLDKPEWYFAQILAWVRDYAEFIGSLLQPVYRQYRGDGQSARSDFTLSLTLLGRSKFLSSLPALLEDDALFTHTMDEVLTFSRTLKQLGFERVQTIFCEILLLPEVFNPWLDAEKALAQNRLDSFLESPTAWKCQYEDDAGSPEDLKVPESAQQFVTMLKGMTDRYELLPLKDRQLDFLTLQLDCIEDFNERLKRHYEDHQDDTYQCACQILPTLATATKFIGDSLEEMTSTPTMLELVSLEGYSDPQSLRRAKELARRIGDITDECSRLARESYLMHLRTDTLDSVRSLVREFAKQGWKSMPSVTEFLVPSMTPAMGELVYVMKTILSSQRDRLLSALYTRYISGLMESLDIILFQEVILENVFTSGGASQAKYDLIGNFALVLHRLTQLPGAGLAKTVEACTVLTMNRGSAMLLAELFAGNQRSDKKSHVETIKKTLADMNLTVLRTDEVGQILRRRTDLDDL